MAGKGEGRAFSFKRGKIWAIGNNPSIRERGTLFLAVVGIEVRFGFIIIYDYGYCNG
jgi:hypothetical protein